MSPNDPFASMRANSEYTRGVMERQTRFMTEMQRFSDKAHQSAVKSQEDFLRAQHRSRAIQDAWKTDPPAIKSTSLPPSGGYKLAIDRALSAFLWVLGSLIGGLAIVGWLSGWH